MRFDVNYCSMASPYQKVQHYGQNISVASRYCFWSHLKTLKLWSNFLFIGLEDYCRRLGEEEELSSLSSGEKKEMRNTLKVIIKFVNHLCKMQFIWRGGRGEGKLG